MNRGNRGKREGVGLGETNEQLGKEENELLRR